MKPLFLLTFISIFFLSSCSQNLMLSTPGVISFHSGEISNTQNTSSLSSKTIKASRVRVSGAIEADMYIDKIEISETGKDWIPIINEPTEVIIKNDETIKFGNSQTIPSGEYHGLRLTIEPKIRAIISSSTIVTHEALPTDMVICLTPGFGTGITSTNTIEFTSANGFLVPFTVESDKETFIILHLEVNVDETSWNSLTLAARATRFSY